MPAALLFFSDARFLGHDQIKMRFELKNKNNDTNKKQLTNTIRNK